MSHRFDPTQIRWREPWQAINPDQAQEFEDEVRREVCAEHAMFGRSAAVVGRRKDRDDFLFYLGNKPPRFAVVHLTFQKEKMPEWPKTTFFDSLEDWISLSMEPAANDYFP